MLYLVFDRGTKQLVSYNDSASELPTLFQTNTVALQLQFVDQDDSAVSGSYLVADVSTQAPRVVIGPAAIGNAAAVEVATALEGAFAWDGVNKWFTGNIDLDTPQMATWIGAASKATGMLEVNLTTGGANPQTMFQGPVTVDANLDAAGSTPASSVNGTGATLTLQTGVGGVTIAGTVVTIAGLNWGTAPSAVIVQVHEDAAGHGLIFANYILGTATTAGFQFELSAVPPNNNYKFTYIPVFNAPLF